MQPASRPASTSTRPVSSPHPRPFQVNTQTKILDSVHGRILCIADIRGRHSALNDLAREANAKAIIHTGDFGFFEPNSLERINDRTLRHLTQYSPLIPNAQRTHLLAPENQPAAIRATVNINLLSEFPLLLSGQIKLQVPVFTVWGACEDVNVVEKFRNGTYHVENLQLIDEATTRCLDVGGVKLRLLGLGGALVPHKMFDNGEGNATIAGGQGTMWTTALQIGELVDTAQRVYDQTETRLLVTHASPGREGIMSQLALVLKADLTISAGLHFRYASSYNEFSVQGDFDGFRKKLLDGKDGFDKVWESVKNQVDAVIDEHQRVLLDKALSVIDRVPPSQGLNAVPPGEEPAWKNCWNWNLCDAAYGTLVLDVKEGRVSAELKSQGFNYAYRRTATPHTAAPTPHAAEATLPTNINANQSSVGPSTKRSTPAPHSEKPIPAHVANAKSPNSTPPPASSSGLETPKDASPSNGNMKSNGASANEKADKDKFKKREKKERKDRERVDRDNKDKEREQKEGDASSALSPQAPPDASTSEDADQLKSPAESASTGARTPTSKRPNRNPWTIFMRMTTAATEAEVREFFGEAKEEITRVNYPPTFGGRAQKIAYVEFGDEKAMRDGLEKHAEKLHDCTPEVVQATDRESRGEHPHYSRGGGRGRGRGFAARGFAAAGLTNKGQRDGDVAPKGTDGA